MRQGAIMLKQNSRLWTCLVVAFKQENCHDSMPSSLLTPIVSNPIVINPVLGKNLERLHLTR